MNQCDGCLRGLAINEHGNHELDGHPIMGCEAYRYEDEDEEPVPSFLSSLGQVILLVSALGFVGWALGG